MYEETVCSLLARVLFPWELWVSVLRVRIIFLMTDETAARPDRTREPSSSLGTDRETLHFSQKKMRCEKNEIFTQ